MTCPIEPTTVTDENKVEIVAEDIFFTSVSDKLNLTVTNFDL
jgi:hypothetical protein